MKSTDFTGTGHIFVGFDVSQDKIAVFAVCGEQRCRKAETIANDKASIANYMKANFPDAHRATVVLETGTHALWMNNLLKAMGYEVIVANARALATIYMSTKKNDELDAEHLARMAQADRGLLKPVELMDRERQLDLGVVKARDLLVRLRTDIVNTVRGLLRAFGESDKGLTSSNMKDAADRLSPEMSPIVKPLLNQLKSLAEGIKTYDRALERLCREKYKATELLQRVGGVGILTSLVFVLLVGDPRRFSSGAKVAAYFGLVPRQDQSGQLDKQLGITKHGNALMRRYLMQAVQYIMKSNSEDCDLRRLGMRIASRGGRNARKKAKVAVARKLTTVLLRLLATPETPYDPLFSAKRHGRRQQTA